MMKDFAVRQVVCSGVWELIMLKRYGNNDNKVQVGGEMEYIVFDSHHKHPHQELLWYTNFLKLTNKDLLIVSTVNPVHAPVKKG